VTAPALIAAVSPVADALDALGVPYYLAGSVISSLHGVARATADVDVVAALRPIHATVFAEQLADAYYADADAIVDAIRRRAMSMSFTLQR
jgi:hypothetical protein